MEQMNFDRAVAEQEEWIKQSGMSYSNLVHFAALALVAHADALDGFAEASDVIEKLAAAYRANNAGKLVESLRELPAMIGRSMAIEHFNGKLAGIDQQKTSFGRKAAEAKHSKPGGSHEKRDAIRAAWASGKYKTLDECAEQAGKALGMPFSTARRVIRNMPNPHLAAAGTG